MGAGGWLSEIAVGLQGVGCVSDVHGFFALVYVEDDAAEVVTSGGVNVFFLVPVGDFDI